MVTDLLSAEMAESDQRRVIARVLLALIREWGYTAGWRMCMGSHLWVTPAVSFLERVDRRIISLIYDPLYRIHIEDMIDAESGTHTPRSAVYRMDDVDTMLASAKREQINRQALECNGTGET